MKLTRKPTTARGHCDHFNSVITHSMADFGQELVKLIHLVAVSKGSAHWDPRLMPAGGTDPKIARGGLAQAKKLDPMGSVC